jgi:enoyl-CoA hydratase/carnithine racemase
LLSLPSIDPNQLNALNKQTLGEISAAFEGMRDDVETKVVILTGSGEKAFVAWRRHQGVSLILTGRKARNWPKKVI